MKNKWKIILASGAEHLKGSLHDKGYSVFMSDVNYDGNRFFYNGDLYTRLARLEDLQHHPVCVIQSGTYSSADAKEKFTPQDRIFETLQILRLLQHPTSVSKVGHKEYKYAPIDPPSKVVLLLTYMPCGKQDHAVRTGESVSALVVLELCFAYCPQIAIIDPHPWKVAWFRTLKAQGNLIKLSMVPYLLEEIKERFPDARLLAPDEGAQARLGLNGFGKKRKNSVQSELIGEVYVKGEHVVFIDDMILTGGTLLRTREKMLKEGVEMFAFAATHALPLMSGEDNLQRVVDTLGENLLVTNTVPSKTFVKHYPDVTLDCTDLIHKFLQSDKFSDT
ncbi:MAG: hypothetical protein GWO20_06280 [Candidatus Korarchaeota archaeon]|nr:hypothetical protein [Candidatus Korarchaeota archaeon]NIU83016.1 hypothetical protein [Candidatus Thorarchaeota archaeon]NIW13450.1 hypothetical protein [Candidatus Thorarchaeota archaeon]NIW51558.1 hypothetical protein [Candidatus Korarchaeota archaeon]